MNDKINKKTPNRYCDASVVRQLKSFVSLLSSDAKNVNKITRELFYAKIIDKLLDASCITQKAYTNKDSEIKSSQIGEVLSLVEGINVILMGLNDSQEIKNSTMVKYAFIYQNLVKQLNGWKSSCLYRD